MKNNHEILTALQYKPLYNIDSSENGVKSIQAGAYNGVGTVYSLQKCEFFLVLYKLHIQRVPTLHAFWEIQSMRYAKVSHVLYQSCFISEMLNINKSKNQKRLTPIIPNINN